MEERQKSLFCWRCNKPLSSLTNPKYEHQLCLECEADDFIIKFCLKCEKELLTNKYQGSRVCEKCHGENRHIATIAQGVAWR